MLVGEASVRFPPWPDPPVDLDMFYLFYYY
jgi:hypothetical protein